MKVEVSLGTIGVFLLSHHLLLYSSTSICCRTWYRGTEHHGFPWRGNYGKKIIQYLKATARFFQVTFSGVRWPQFGVSKGHLEQAGGIPLVQCQPTTLSLGGKKWLSLACFLDIWKKNHPVFLLGKKIGSWPWRHFFSILMTSGLRCGVVTYVEAKKWFFVQMEKICNFSSQSIATSHDRFPPQMVANSKGNPRLFQGNRGWWNIIIWPEFSKRWKILRCIFPDGERKQHEPISYPPWN